MSAPAPPVRLAVLGDPIAHSRSPDLHRAGLAVAGVEGTSEAFRTNRDELPARLRELRAAGYRGVNLTHPLKEAALGCVDGAGDDARAARSINTVVFAPDGVRGETTDGAGFVALLEELGLASTTRVVLLGAGAAARSIARHLDPAELVVSSRRSVAGGAGRTVAWRSDGEREALAGAALVVNCTPLSDALELPLDGIGRQAAIIDLVYRDELTPWVRAARARGHRAWDGLGLLVHQARLSLALWLGREIPLAPLARAVGWPR